MLGWLVTNKYLVGEKFSLLKSKLISEAKSLDIDLASIDNLQTRKIISDKNYKKPDFVLFWDKDINLGLQLKNDGLKLYNELETIRIGDDKALTYLTLNKYNIPMPKTIPSPQSFGTNISTDKDFLEYINNEFSFPYIIKECFGSFGMQVYLSHNQNETLDIINKINGKAFIVQEFIKTSESRDVRIEIVNKKALCAMYRKNETGDFRSNLTLGAKSYYYEPTIEQVDLAEKVADILNLDFGGIDILFGDNDEPILNEVNSNAHFINLTNVSKINVANEILNYIKNDLR